jgi:hypothetical protein
MPTTRAWTLLGGMADVELAPPAVGGARPARQDGKVEGGTVRTGQIASLIHGIAPVGAIVERLVCEAEAAQGRGASPLDG